MQADKLEIEAIEQATRSFRFLQLACEGPHNDIQVSQLGRA